MNLIGRHKEKDELSRMINSGKSEFVVVYGRRRVGKTFLIRQYFGGNFAFYSTGLADGKLESQLINFNAALRANPNYHRDKDAENWMGAFRNLAQVMELEEATIKVIFIDELPWMDTRNSDLLVALDYFWNAWASARSDIKLITCGSSASWMIKNLLRNTRGLYNRVTNRINLEPFNLSETKEYLQSKKGNYSHMQIVELYMALGGIPYYLSFVKPEWSVAQNIKMLFFEANARFKGEYELIFASLYKNYEKHISVVNALTKRKSGLFKAEIVKETKIADGGTLTTVLNELEASNFIRKYNMPGKKVRNRIYQLTDNFILFYSNFVLNREDNDPDFWKNRIGTPSYYAWAGNAFEMVCLQHSEKIKKALGISGIMTNTYSWANSKAQIDLIFDRSDKVINLIEIKFSEDVYAITADYGQKLRNKISEFKADFTTNKAIWIILLTTYGLANVNNTENVHTSLTMEIFFDNG